MGMKLSIAIRRGGKIGQRTCHAWSSQRRAQNPTPNDLKGQSFDGEQERQQLLGTGYQNVEKAPGKLDPSLKAIIENSDHALLNLQQPASQEEIIEETIEKCISERELVPVTLKHELVVKVIKKPNAVQTIRICKGHTKEEKSRNPSHDKDKQKEKFRADPTIKSFNVYVEDCGVGHRDKVISWYQHVNDAPSAINFTETQTTGNSDQWEEEDSWQMDQQGLLDSLDCTLISTENGPPETRLIDGREVYRPSWSKTHQMQCIVNRQKKCEFLNKKTCIQMYKVCINNFGGECLAWETTFKCRTRTYRSSENESTGLYGTDSNLWKTDYEPCSAFPDVATKLAVFDEMKKELQNSQAEDARMVTLFKGNKQKCSKSVLEDVMYDCCQGMDGFATQVKLSKCTSDEIALAEARKKGLTHLVGSKKEDFIGLWNSQKGICLLRVPYKTFEGLPRGSQKAIEYRMGECRASRLPRTYTGRDKEAGFYQDELVGSI